MGHRTTNSSGAKFMLRKIGINHTAAMHASDAAAFKAYCNGIKPGAIV